MIMNPVAALRQVRTALTTAAWGPVPVTVPPLRVQAASEPSAQLFFLCPDEPQPAGGVRKLYRHVEILVDAGINATVLHHKFPFKCNWFEHAVPLAWADRDSIPSSAAIVLPEIYAVHASLVPPSLERILLCQNPFYLISGAPVEEAEATRRLLNTGNFSYVVSISDYTSEVLNLVMPGTEIRRVVYGIDNGLFREYGERSREILYMPRKRGRDLRDLFIMMGGIQSSGWNFTALHGVSEAQTALKMGQAGIFISMGDREGFGLPPAEAMLSGCVVVGFDGLGGREFMQQINPFTVAEGDIVGLVRTLEQVIARWDQNDGWRTVREQASAYIAQNYSREREIESVLNAYC